MDTVSFWTTLHARDIMIFVLAGDIWLSQMSYTLVKYKHNEQAPIFVAINILIKAKYKVSWQSNQTAPLQVSPVLWAGDEAIPQVSCKVLLVKKEGVSMFLCMFDLSITESAGDPKNHFPISYS